MDVDPLVEVEMEAEVEMGLELELELELDSIVEQSPTPGGGGPRATSSRNFKFSHLPDAYASAECATRFRGRARR